MKTCIDDIRCGRRTIIGIRDYGPCMTPESGLWINDLPGMSLRTAAQVASEEYVSGAEFLREKINLGAKLVVNDFTEYMGDLFNFNAVVETRNVGRFDEVQTLAAAPLERGQVWKRWRSEVGRLYVEQIYLKSSASGVATVKIYDGQIVKTYTVDVLANQTMTVEIGYTADSEKIRIVFDQTNFPVYTYTMNQAGMGCGSCGSSAPQGLYVSGWDGTQERATGYGLGAKVSVRCYEENVLCGLLPRLHFLMWYRGGIETCSGIMYSNRVTPIAMFGKEDAAKLREELQKEYAINYNRLKKNISRHMLSLKADCTTCKGDQYVQQIP